MTPMHPTPPDIHRAFILGAGLGTRLRPLTKKLPKPLLPLGGRPMVTRALEHLAALGIRDVIINTHHAAVEWTRAFPNGGWRGTRITLRHEPVLLDTGGGLKNVQDFLSGHGTFLIYNGDVVSTLPLACAIKAHRQSGNLVTLVLRSDGSPRHVTLDAQGRIADIRGLLGTGHPGEFLFTGIHVVEPEVFNHIPDASPRSIIPIYLDLIRAGQRLGGVVLDEGEWSDLGTLAEYEQMRARLGA